MLDQEFISDTEPLSGTEATAGIESRRAQEGSLLIELLVGAFVAVVALVAIMSVVLSSALMRRQNAEITLAYTAATNVLEELRTLPMDEIILRDNTGFDIPAMNGAAGGLRSLPSDADNMPGALTVTLDSSGAGSSVYLVVAQVDWTGPKGRQRIQLESLIGARTAQ